MEAKEDLDEVAFEEAWAAELAERSSDDDHFYGPWNSGSGGRGVPTSSAAVKAASRTKAIRKAQDKVTKRQVAFEVAKQQAYKDLSNLTYERYIALDEKGHRIYDQTQRLEGNVMINYGDTLPDVEANEFHSKGDVVLEMHNHPATIESFEGYDIPFSPPDIAAAFSMPNLKETQVITADSIFSIKPGPDGWGSSGEFYHLVYSRYDLGPEVYQMPKLELETKLGDFWNGVAQEMGWKYARTPRISAKQTKMKMQ